MRRLRIVVSALVFAYAVSGALAQAALDVSKTTCHRWVEDKTVNQLSIALWLSGYYNGTKGDPVLDMNRLDGDAKKLGEFCAIYKQASVMEAAEAVFAANPLFEAKR
jgi:acid stress chaperone HdeB